MDVHVELRQLRYFVAVAEELHFGRAAERLHMSQSPLSRAIRELEREMGVVLFVRTSRRVELTSAGAVLLERSRRALAEIDSAVADARLSSRPQSDVLDVGCGPFSRPILARIAAEFEANGSGLRMQLHEEVTPEALRRIAAHELAAAVVMESPAASRQHGVRIDTLRDEPLLAALPESHEFADAPAIPVAAFVAEVVLLPREPPGQLFNAWFRALIRSVGVELDRTLQTMSAPWDRRMLPVAAGAAVCPFVAEWVADAPGVVGVPFDPPLSFPTDLASRWPPTEGIDSLVDAALRARDAEGWLTERHARILLPSD